MNNSNHDDEQMARDMQLAYELQAAETEAHREEEEQQRQELNRIAAEQEQRLRQLQQDQQTAQQLMQQEQQQQQHDAFDYPASRSRRASGYAASSSNNGAAAATPIVQGHPTPARPAAARPGTVTRMRSAPPSATASGAKQAVTTDGFTLQENQNLIYVPAAINDRPVEMMVDTGAQSSVISAQLMRKLGLEGKLNTRMQGVAQGVGRASILGIVEHCPAVIGHVEFLLYFLVLDVAHDMIIMGIDQMRRFKCVVDLEDEKLIFGGKDGVQVSFLPPEKQWLNARNQAVNDNCSIS